MLIFVVLILTLSLIVMTHEFGHFIVAKKNGVEVQEFGVGIPPRLFGKKLGETIYSVNLLPFGGFVKLKGEDEFVVSSDAPKDPRSFASKTPFQRATILSAGVLMNLITGILIYYILLSLNGFRSLSMPLFFDYSFKYGNQQNIDTTVMSFSEDSPAEGAGIQTGEAVLELDGVRVSSAEEVRNYVFDKEGKVVKVLVSDLKQASSPYRVVEVEPRKLEGGEGAVLGVYLSPSVSIHYDGFWQRLFSGPMHSYNVLAYTAATMKNLISVSFEAKDIDPVASSVSGPVGIYSVIEGIFKYGGPKAYLGLLDLIGLMSISLAVVNLLPIPALDGGRLLFVVLEGIRGKKVLPELEEGLHRWGMLVLLLLLVLVSARDLLRIFG